MLVQVLSACHISIHSSILNVVALAVTFGVLQGIVLINGALQRRQLLPTYVTRKLIHLFAAPVYVVCWLLYMDRSVGRYFAFLVPLAFVTQFALVGLGLRKDEAFVKSMSRSGDPRELLGGTMHYVIVMALCTLLFFDVGDGKSFNPTALLILGALAGGDGLADIIGRRYGGKRTFGFRGATKTLTGTLAMFVGSLVMILLLATPFALMCNVPIVSILEPAILVSVLATLAEAISPPGADNYTIPVSVFVGIILLLALDRWPFGSLSTL